MSDPWLDPRCNLTPEQRRDELMHRLKTSNRLQFAP
jgi:hypothetical protein